jgi:hypothetical protein
MRLEMKSRAKEARRSVRYRQFENREKLREAAAGTGGKRLKTASRRAMASARKQTTEGAGERLLGLEWRRLGNSLSVHRERSPARCDRGSAPSSI